ncbi:MAG: DUF5916 domain-containing protein [Longimicrobiales bacterium]
MSKHATVGTTIALCLLLGAPAAQAQEVAQRTQDASTGGDSAIRTMSAVRLDATQPITIDGRIDEAAWQTAQPTDGFIQVSPEMGEPSHQRTEVRMLYDDQAIYVAARLYDTAPDSVVARLGRRDDMVYSDWFHVAFDSYHDHRTAFAFGVNAAGMKQDLFLYNDTNDDVGWEAVWEAAATIDGQGWVAELRIPFSQLRYNAAPGPTTWGVNFRRGIARYGEESFWTAVNPSEPKLVSIFGDLHGLEDLGTPRRIELQPYALSRLAREPGDAADPFHDETALSASAGADLKVGITSDLTLTATINPDFGQVEADPSVVNLTAYESFFPEKRPFFLEGADIFNFGLGLGDGGNESLFYSRRIGRAPQGAVPGDAEYVDRPSATTILSAAKLSGKTSGGWSIGVLDALTTRERAPYILQGGTQGEIPVEPLTNYAVARVIKDFRQGESAIGGIVTAMHREIEHDNLDFLTTSAYAGGLDVRHRFAGGDYYLRTFLLGSAVNGSTAALTRVQRAPGRYFQRPDADHVDSDTTRTSLSGAAGSLEVGKQAGGNWKWITAVQAISPGFEVNDMGFQTQTDVALHVGWLGYDQRRAGGHLQRWNVNWNAWHGYSFGGERVTLGGNTNGSFTLKNYWNGYGGIGLDNLDSYSTDALRGGPALRRSPSMSLWGGLNSDNRESVRYGIGVNVSQNLENPSESLRLGPYVNWRASERMDLSLSPSVSWNTNDAQYISRQPFAGADHYIFGRIDQATVATTLRLGYTVSPDLSFQLYASPFVSAGEYSAFREVADPRASDYGARFRTLESDEVAYDDAADVYRLDLDRDGSIDASFGNPDFNFKQLRSTAVLRWEYRPGSALFLVWSQGRTGFDRDDGSVDLRRDFGRLFAFDSDYDVPGSNVLLIKASYWLGL